MYIMITDHCNMTCAHCCVSASPRKKNFMSLETFEKALEMCDDSVSLGGGEPTLHPLFWAFLGMSLSVSDNVWLATNGSVTKTALRLADMAKRGVIGCDLSLDYYHSEIDDRVIDAFKRLNSIRNTPDSKQGVLRQGRAIKTEVWQSYGCVCEDTYITPNGNIYSCGCRKLLIGDVYNGYNAIGERYFALDGTDGCLFHGDVYAIKRRSSLLF